MFDCLPARSIIPWNQNKSKRADFKFLPVLPQLLLEKTIVKLDTKSYHRLQQTCKGIRNLVENNRNIKLYLDSIYRIAWCTSGDHQFYFYNTMGSAPLFRSRTVETFKGSYGLHFKNLMVFSGSYFDKTLILCQDLKKYRITCTHLAIDVHKLTVPQCLIIFNALRPRKVELNLKPNQYEVILRTDKLISDVTLSLNSWEATRATEQLLPFIERLTFTVRTTELTSDGFHQMIMEILKLLQSLKLQTRRVFKLYRSDEERIKPSVKEIFDILGAYSPRRCGMSWRYFDEIYKMETVPKNETQFGESHQASNALDFMKSYQRKTRPAVGIQSNKCNYPYLPELERHLLEKVITKLSFKGYHRIQQTCKDMLQFVENNRYIFIYLDSAYVLESYEADQFYFKSARWRSPGFYCKKKDSYKLNIQKLHLPSDFEEKCEVLCQGLKACRVTCTHLDVKDQDLTMEQFVTVFNALKPVSVTELRTKPSYKALLLTQNPIPEVTINLNLKDAVQVTKTLFPRIGKITLIVNTTESTSEEYYNMILEIIEVLRSLKPEEPRCFILHRSYEKKQIVCPTRLLGEFNPKRFGCGWKCVLGERPFCVVTIEERFGGIRYEYR